MFPSRQENFQTVLPAYTSVYMQNPKNLEDGDKIILPETILEDLLNCNDQGETRIGLPEPVIFEITNIKHKKISHCGVLEFSSLLQQVYLPNQMMENLLLTSGDNVKLLLKTNIPKLEYVLFKPMTYKFANTANDPKVALEHALCRFTVLTKGDSIDIKTPDGKYTFHVIDIKPDIGDPAAGCLLDSDVKVEFDTPLENLGNMEYEEIKFSELVSGEVEAEAFKYYKLRLKDNCNNQIAIKFELISISGDADLYVSASSTNINRINHDQAINSIDSQKVLLIQFNDAKLVNENGIVASWLQIAINGYRKDSVFNLKIEQVPIEKTNFIRSVSTTSSDQNINDINVETNKSRCSNCYRYIPKESASLHSIRCVRSNQRCSECGLVMQLSQKEKHSHCPKCKAVVDPDSLEKHDDIAHTPIECECKQFFDPSLLIEHKKTECVYRKRKCQYCKIDITFKDLDNHESWCGSRTFPCDQCGKHVRRNNIDTHNAIYHGINPCIDSKGSRRRRTLEDDEHRQKQRLSNNTSKIDRVSTSSLINRNGNFSSIAQDAANVANLASEREENERQILESVIEQSRKEFDSQIQRQLENEEIGNERVEDQSMRNIVTDLTRDNSVEEYKLNDDNSWSDMVLDPEEQVNENNQQINDDGDTYIEEIPSQSTTNSIVSNRESLESSHYYDLTNEDSGNSNSSNNDRFNEDLGYHEYSCPYCQKPIPLRIDMEEHMIQCHIQNQKPN